MSSHVEDPELYAACARRLEWLRSQPRTRLRDVAAKLVEKAADPSLSERVAWMLRWTAEQALAIDRGTFGQA